MTIEINNKSYEDVAEIKTINGSTYIHAHEGVIFDIFCDMEEAGAKVFRPDYNPFNQYYYTMALPKDTLVLVTV